ncbi:uncharacterized protein Ocrl [Prorops nasuta]|uniref:uncharacterized protein Ocrl n=1 Tax=Prorops nasuta TaxID=863751 RepID=UPI0034CF0BE4
MFKKTVKNTKCSTPIKSIKKYRLPNLTISSIEQGESNDVISLSPKLFSKSERPRKLKKLKDKNFPKKKFLKKEKKKWPLQAGLKELTKGKIKNHRTPSSLSSPLSSFQSYSPIKSQIIYNKTAISPETTRHDATGTRRYLKQLSPLLRDRRLFDDEQEDYFEKPELLKTVHALPVVSTNESPEILKTIHAIPVVSTNETEDEVQWVSQELQPFSQYNPKQFYHGKKNRRHLLTMADILWDEYMQNKEIKEYFNKDNSNSASKSGCMMRQGSNDINPNNDSHDSDIKNKKFLIFDEFLHTDSAKEESCLEEPERIRTSFKVKMSKTKPTKNSRRQSHNSFKISDQTKRNKSLKNYKLHKALNVADSESEKDNSIEMKNTQRSINTDHADESDYFNLMQKRRRLNRIAISSDSEEELFFYTPKEINTSSVETIPEKKATKDPSPQSRNSSKISDHIMSNSLSRDHERQKVPNVADSKCEKKSSIEIKYTQRSINTNHNDESDYFIPVQQEKCLNFIEISSDSEEESFFDTRKEINTSSVETILEKKATKNSSHQSRNSSKISDHIMSNSLSRDHEQQKVPNVVDSTCEKESSIEIKYTQRSMNTNHNDESDYFIPVQKENCSNFVEISSDSEEESFFDTCKEINTSSREIIPEKKATKNSSHQSRHSFKISDHIMSNSLSQDHEQQKVPNVVDSKCENDNSIEIKNTQRSINTDHAVESDYFNQLQKRRSLNCIAISSDSEEESFFDTRKEINTSSRETIMKKKATKYSSLRYRISSKISDHIMSNSLSQDHEQQEVPNVVDSECEKDNFIEMKNTQRFINTDHVDESDYFNHMQKRRRLNPIIVSSNSKEESFFYIPKKRNTNLRETTTESKATKYKTRRFRNSSKISDHMMSNSLLQNHEQQKVLIVNNSNSGMETLARIKSGERKFFKNKRSKMFSPNHKINTQDLKIFDFNNTDTRSKGKCDKISYRIIKQRLSSESSDVDINGILNGERKLSLRRKDKKSNHIKYKTAVAAANCSNSNSKLVSKKKTSSNRRTITRKSFEAEYSEETGSSSQTCQLPILRSCIPITHTKYRILEYVENMIYFCKIKNKRIMFYTNYQLSIVQSKFTTGETVIITMEASLMQGWVRAQRLIALVNKGSTNALVVLLTSRTPPQVYSDLTIERILPIDQDFKCDIGTDGKVQEGTDVYLNVTSRKLRLVFEMKPGVGTSTLVSEIFRAIEVYQKAKSPAAEYIWIQKLTGSTRSLNSEDMSNVDPLVDLESPDLVVPRRNIASGKSPVAARDSVVRYHMACKEDDYTYTKTFRIFIGTWNVNGQPPNGITLEEWLSNEPDAPDIYAIGFQELDLSKEAFFFADIPREEEWRQVVAKSLHQGAIFSQVAIVRLVGMMLIVYAKEEHMPFIKNVSTDTVGTGIMGKMGNKGGVAVSCCVHNTSMCFVNAHLAAHCEDYERRNQDYADICARLSFSKYVPPKGFKDHDQIYWLGDLNYRITEMDATVAKHYILSEDYGPVLTLDQLVQQKQLGKVLQGFHEAEIKFKPTYKYDPGTDNWDSSEKSRAPAWCDRVLWKGDSISSVSYKSHPQLKISDHKPVSAIFDSQIRIIDSVKYRKIHEEVMKKLDKLENEFLPQVMVDTTEIIFDTLKFLEPRSKELIIANTGQVPVQFEFIKKLGEASYCKDWLHIEPYTGFIKPGEKCDIKLEICVDKKSACKINSGDDKLYDILVLHLEGGKDIFITVTGSYERSCFGFSMEALIHIRVPIREVPIGRLVELEHNKNPSSEPYSIPKEIWLLVDKLYLHGLKTTGLFEKPGLHSEILAIRDWLDSWSQDPMPGGVHSVAEALLLLLESTAEPLIPYNLHNVCLAAATNYLQCKQLVMQLPETRRAVFLYICIFLQELLNHSQDNGLDAKTLATLFGSIFLRDPPRSRSDRNQRSQATFDRKKAAFVYYFLVNDQSDFIPGR